MNDPQHLERARLRMVERHIVSRGIRAPRVLDALRKIPRELFLPADVREHAYHDEAVSIDCGQTISQPLMVAMMTAALELSGSEHVLEIGTGSGYHTAVLAELAGWVVSVERHAELSRQAGTLLAQLGYRNLTLVVGDGTDGWPSAAPYERIIVTAAAGQIPPALVGQLANGGRLAIPVGSDASQSLQVVTKRGDRLAIENLSACRFVPLVGASAPQPHGADCGKSK